jgi:hypothetical protein
MVAVDRTTMMSPDVNPDFGQIVLRYRAVSLFGIEPKSIAQHKREQEAATGGKE